MVGEVKLTFEELATTLAQIEACLYSRPLTPLPNDSEGLEVLAPGHFLIGKPLTALSDPIESCQPIMILHRCNLCQRLINHFWNRWSQEYLTTLNRLYIEMENPYTKRTSRRHRCLRDEPTIPTKWPLARSTEVHPGRDGNVRVVTVRTPKGSYKRPIIKSAPILRPD